MKKNKIVTIISIILFIIFVVFSVLIFVNSIGNTEKKEEKDFVVTNWKIHKDGNSYILSFDLNNNKEKQLALGKYKFYLLDSDDNLIYLVEDFIFDPTKSKKLTINYKIDYDISSIDKVLFAEENEKIKYKKDLTKKKDTEKNVTTIESNVMDESAKNNQSNIIPYQ